MTSKTLCRHKHTPFKCFANTQFRTQKSATTNLGNRKEDRCKYIQNVISSIKNQQHLQMEPKKIVMDFSSPNIAKPFHFGHLRSTIIGNFIANINRHFENNVTAINYLGDWGTQFGLLQCGLKYKNLNVNDLNDNPMKKLLDAYIHANKMAEADKDIYLEARQYFSDIEQGKTNLDDWRKLKKITENELERVYKRLGIKFDEYNWESDYNGAAIKHVIALLENKNIIKTDDTGKKVTKVGNRIVTVLKSDESTLYLTRDIAALLDRYKRYKFDEMLYVVGNEQTDHLNAVFDIVRRVDEDCAKACKHIKFGRLHGMSTRSGNVVFLNDILDEAKHKMFEIQKNAKNTRSSAMNDDTCDTLGITAVLINDMKQRRIRDYTFEWDRALQSEGDSGIKLQYLHCRLWSLEQNCGVALPYYLDANYLPEPVVDDVIAELAKFNDILLRTKAQYEACILINYLFTLSRHVNRMYKEMKVKEEISDVASQRLLVFHTARLVIKKSLEILGVKPLNEM